VLGNTNVSLGERLNKMISSIRLKFGRAPNLPPVTISPTAVTVFVGPNNSGKSKVLSEISGICSQGGKQPSDVIVDNIEFEPIPASAAQRMIEAVIVQPNPGETIHPDNVLVGKSGRRHHVPKSQLLEAMANPNANLPIFCQWYLSYNTLILGGQNRIALVNDQGAGDLQQNPTSSFQVLLRDDTRRENIRKIIHEAFGSYFVLDPTALGTLRLRLSARAPINVLEERGIHDEAIKFHSAAQRILEASDGVKAFTGMLTEIIAGDPSILLIDEPEAFLHPALSSTLGKEIAKASRESRKRIFISTHSPNFVMGCIQSGSPVSIVRLTYRDKIATARILPNEDILRLMRNPLLRSTGVLNGLFYEFVVVTESDADRAFYQEINERLLTFKPEWGIPNCLFINAQNKQTVHVIAKPLRELGIPTACVVDVDVLKEGGSVWTDFLGGAFVPAISHQPLGQQRALINAAIVKTGKDMKRDGGIELLSVHDKAAANDLFDQLSAYGLFVVRKGELESWMKPLQVPGHGPAWLIEVFGKLGEDPESAGYLKPQTNDVWEFIYSIKRWLTDANRKGIPQ